MFKIFATICSLSIGPNNQTLCFKSEVPLKFNNSVDCVIARDSVVDYMHEDLLERSTTILFECKETVQTYET